MFLKYKHLGVITGNSNTTFNIYVKRVTSYLALS